MYHARGGISYGISAMESAFIARSRGSRTFIVRSTPPQFGSGCGNGSDAFAGMLVRPATAPSWHKSLHKRQHAIRWVPPCQVVKSVTSNHEPSRQNTPNDAKRFDAEIIEPLISFVCSVGRRADFSINWLPACPPRAVLRYTAFQQSRPISKSRERPEGRPSPTFVVDACHGAGPPSARKSCTELSMR